MLIKFCDTCNNDMYIKWDEEELVEGRKKYMILFCKKCGEVEKLKKEDFNRIDKSGAEKMDQVPPGKKKYSPIIYKKKYENRTIDSRLFNNEFIKYDRTLPFVEDDDIDCPNKDCASNVEDEEAGKKKEEKKILYQIYDNDNMKYLYTCKICNTSWTIH